MNTLPQEVVLSVFTFLDPSTKSRFAIAYLYLCFSLSLSMRISFAVRFICTREKLISDEETGIAWHVITYSGARLLQLAIVDQSRCSLA